MALVIFSLLFFFFKFSKSNFTATFYFGDSLLDTGNNNFLPTLFKANHLPYGRDFPTWIPTGRFSNGLMIPDLLSSKLKMKDLVPPYLDPKLTQDEILTGVNFESAGAGYDEMTSLLTGTMPVNRQVNLFEEYVGKLKGIVGEKEAGKIVGQSLVMFSSGSNDFAANFFARSGRRLQFGLIGYIDFLHKILEGAIKKLYYLGARKFIIAGVPPFGCMPANIVGRYTDPFMRGKCIMEQVSTASTYNSKLQNLLPQLQQSLVGCKIVYMDFHNNLLDMINNPSKYGFVETRKGCCGSTGSLEMGALCNSFSPTFSDASTYAFFDGFHPTERVYKLLTDQIMQDIIPQLQ